MTVFPTAIVLVFKEEPKTTFFVTNNNLMSTDIKKAHYFNNQRELEAQLSKFPKQLGAIIILTHEPHTWIQEKD